MGLGFLKPFSHWRLPDVFLRLDLRHQFRKGMSFSGHSLVWYSYFQSSDNSVTYLIPVYNLFSLFFFTFNKITSRIISSQHCFSGVKMPARLYCFWFWWTCFANVCFRSSKSPISCLSPFLHTCLIDGSQFPASHAFLSLLLLSHSLPVTKQLQSRE